MSERGIRPREAGQRDAVIQRDAADPRDPVRLVHDRELGPLVSRANATYRAGLDETGAFQRLSQRLEKPERSWPWQGLTLGAVLSLAAGVVVVLSVFDDAPSRVAVGPEVSMGRRTLREESRRQESDAPPMGARALPAVRGLDVEPSSDDAVANERPGSPSAESARTESPRTESPNAESRVPSAEAQKQVVGVPHLSGKPGPQRGDATERTRQDDAREGSTHEGPARTDARVERTNAPPKHDLEAPSVTSAAVEPEEDARKQGERSALLPAVAATDAPSSTRAVEARLDCSDLLETDARSAENCYARRATESSGLSAEAALYELARLRRDVQRDPKGALAALNDYRDRFPQGSLRNEVGLSRVELLSGLGRSREALSEAEALLASAKGSERAAELHQLRGDIYRRDLADYARAAQEYAKVEGFGGSFGAEATRLRGLCLEALGDVTGALAAYHRYLSGPEQPRKTEVNRRVEALTASQRSTAP